MVEKKLRCVNGNYVRISLRERYLVSYSEMIRVNEECVLVVGRKLCCLS